MHWASWGVCCFLPGRAKDLSAPPHTYLFQVSNRLRNCVPYTGCCLHAVATWTCTVTCSKNILRLLAHCLVDVFGNQLGWPFIWRFTCHCLANLLEQLCHQWWVSAGASLSSWTRNIPKFKPGTSQIHRWSTKSTNHSTEMFSYSEIRDFCSTFC